MMASQVRAGDLVGASLEGECALRVWSCTLDNINPAQPVRYAPATTAATRLGI